MNAFNQIADLLESPDPRDTRVAIDQFYELGMECCAWWVRYISFPIVSRDAMKQWLSYMRSGSYYRWKDIAKQHDSPILDAIAEWNTAVGAPGPIQYAFPKVPTTLHYEVGSLARTLRPEDLGESVATGWTLKGDVIEDYYEWVNEFEATHPEHGYVKGDFESVVEASSDFALGHFLVYFEPNEWDYHDI